MQLLSPLVFGFATLWVAAMWCTLLWALSRMRARIAEDGTRTIRMHRVVPIVPLLASASLSVFGPDAALAHAGAPVAWAIGLVFGAGGLALLTCFAPANDVTWSDEAITGPAS